MGKKRKFNRFIKWIKSDLPEEKTSVLLLGVTKLSSPTLQRRTSSHSSQNRPHTLHFEFPASSTTEFINGTTEILSENSQNVDKPAKSFDLAPPIKSSSFSSTKENTSPILSLKSSSFSGKQLEGKLRKKSFENNSIRKRVSFSNDTQEIIKSRDIARHNRDLKLNNVIDVDCEYCESEINNRFAEIPVGYYNNYAVVNENQDIISDTEKIEHYRIRRQSSVDVNQFGDILDEISNDLNIRPISRRNSSITQPTLPENINKLRRRKSSVVELIQIGDILDEISDDLNIRPISRKNSSTSSPSVQEGTTPSSALLQNLIDKFNKHETDFPENLDYNKNKFSTTEKYYSENDIYDKILPKIAYQRKLSAPITPVQVDDVNDFINEIIQELDIGPKLRSRSQSTKSEYLSYDDTASTSPVVDSSNTTEDDKINSVSSITSESDTSTSSSSSIPIPTSSQTSDSNAHTLDVVLTQSNPEDQIMDRSVDSIGSCSLDVDLSTDFSDSSRGSISDCTLRSVSILTPVSNGVRKAKSNIIPTSNSTEIHDESTNQNSSDPVIKITDTDQQVTSNKKPSYLNLACCVNGYSNLTTYDSKLRETYRSGTPRSREVSPNRPLDNYNVGYNQMTKGESTYLTPESATKQRSISPGRLKLSSPKMGDEYIKTNGSTTTTTTTTTNQNGGSSISKKNFFSSSTTSTTSSYLSAESRNFASSMLFNKTTDVTDSCMNKENHYTKIENTIYTKSTQKIYNDQELLNNTLASKSILNIGGPRECNSDISISESRIKMSPSKSFIQQRVERLYGPGALAQGFFIQTKRSPRKSECEEHNNSKHHYEDENSNQTHLETNEIHSSESTPSLPVLRHLRPEFRAQLPILSPKRTIHENGGSIQKSTTIPIALKDNISPSRIIRSAEQLTKLNGDDSSSVQSSDSFESLKELKKSKASENLIKLESEHLQHVLIEPEHELQSTISNEIITEYLPAAPKVILPVVSTTNGTIDTLIITNGGDCIQKNQESSITDDGQKKDGHYFLKILKTETDRLNILAEEVEKELELKMSVLPDDALGYLRSASGKARLLVNQKMQQFEGLCHKNINQIAGEPFPTTAEDLQGFWDMVMLQINQVNDLFKDLDELRANNWVVELKPKKSATDIKPRTKLVTKKASPVQTSANSELQRIKREAQRKLMLEQRRAMMAAAKKNSNNDQNVEIFVPESSSTLNS